MEFKFKVLNLGEILKYYNNDIIEINCRNCQQYATNWSCPPHDFHEKEYLSKYEYHYIIVFKINRSKAFEKDYHKYRKIIGDKLLKIQKKFSNIEILYAGNCYQCVKCSRIYDINCKYTNQMRYSYESLGIELLKLTENEFHIKKNEGLKIILGIMFNDKSIKHNIKGELKEIKNELL